ATRPRGRSAGGPAAPPASRPSPASRARAGSASGGTSSRLPVCPSPIFIRVPPGYPRSRRRPDKKMSGPGRPPERPRRDGGPARDDRSPRVRFGPGPRITLARGPGGGPIRRRREGRCTMFWFYCLLLTLGRSDRGAAEATDWMKPAAWTGNFWGPPATRARATGQLPPLPSRAGMTRWSRWGRDVLRDGDIVFRLGDARTLHGTFPLSRFIARASGSPFSHTGIVAIEDGSPVVYDCSSEGVQRQPFEVWMLDCVGAFGGQRLPAEYPPRIPGL